MKIARAAALVLLILLVAKAKRLLRPDVASESASALKNLKNRLVLLQALVLGDLAALLVLRVVRHPLALLLVLHLLALLVLRQNLRVVVIILQIVDAAIGLTIVLISPMKLDVAATNLALAHPPLVALARRQVLLVPVLHLLAHRQILPHMCHLLQMTM